MSDGGAERWVAWFGPGDVKLELGCGPVDGQPGREHWYFVPGPGNYKCADGSLTSARTYSSFLAARAAIDSATGSSSR